MNRLEKIIKKYDRALDHANNMAGVRERARDYIRRTLEARRELAQVGIYIGSADTVLFEDQAYLIIGTMQDERTSLANKFISHNYRNSELLSRGCTIFYVEDDKILVYPNPAMNDKSPLIADFSDLDTYGYPASAIVYLLDDYAFLQNGVIHYLGDDPAVYRAPDPVDTLFSLEQFNTLGSDLVTIGLQNMLGLEAFNNLPVFHLPPSKSKNDRYDALKEIVLSTS